MVIKNKLIWLGALCLFSEAQGIGFLRTARRKSVVTGLVVGGAATAAACAYWVYKNAAPDININFNNEVDIPNISLEGPTDEQALEIAERGAKARVQLPECVVAASSSSVPHVDEYVVVEHSHIQEKQENIIRGAQYIDYLWFNVGSHDMPRPINKLGDVPFVQSVIDVVWYFYQLAKNKEQVFEEGAFIVHDPGFKLFKRLHEYVCLCDSSPEVEKYTSECYAYCRKSSHLTEYYKATGQPKQLHYGIYTNLKGVDPLPANKHHILFGIADAQRELLFIKPENAGLSLTEVAQHGRELLHSIAVKAAGSAYDDSPNFRKERVPRVVQDVFKQNATAVDKTQVGRGIQYLVELGHSLNQQNQALRDQADVCCASYDHIPLRIGREVIITAQEVARYNYSLNKGSNS